MKYLSKKRIASFVLLRQGFIRKSAAALFLMALMEPGSAADLSLRPRYYSTHPACNYFVLSCENGQHYGFCPRGVGELGDVVTGTLFMGPRHVHMRLIPSGGGYRYAGPGVWFDGLESEAVLNFGGRHSVACTVTAGGAGYHNRFSFAY